MRFSFILLFLYSAMTFAANSQENRNGLEYQAAIGLGKLEEAPGYSLRLAKFLNPNNLIGVDFNLSSDGATEDDEKETSFNLNFKHFLGNSFYVHPRAYYVNWSMKDEDERHDHRVTAMGLGFSLGNQWQWDRFTLGADWLSVKKHLIYFHDEKANRHLFFGSLFIYFGWSWD